MKAWKMADDKLTLVTELETEFCRQGKRNDIL